MVVIRKAQYRNNCFKLFEDVQLEMLVDVVGRHDPLQPSGIYLAAQDVLMLITSLPKKAYDMYAMADLSSEADATQFSGLCESLQGCRCITFQKLNEIIRGHGLGIVPLFIEDEKKRICTHYICGVTTVKKILARGDAPPVYI